MELTQIKVRGLPGLENTGWQLVHPQLTILQSQGDQQGLDCLRALEAINPVLDLAKNNPLKNYLRYSTLNGHTKQVAANKKTSVYGIFTATPKLIMELGKINESLYETDRIEVGRRLDLSRWISFVEIPGSSKLAELERKAAPIFKTLSPQLKDEYQTLINTWVFTDRISGRLSDELRQWWKENIPGVSDNDLATQCLKIIELEHETNLARQLVEKRMPFTIFITPGEHLQPPYRNFKSSIKQPDSFFSFLQFVHRHLFQKFEDQAAAVQEEIETITANLDLSFAQPQIKVTENSIYSKPRKDLSTCIDQILTAVILAKAAKIAPPIFLFDLDEISYRDGNDDNLVSQLAELSSLCQLITQTSSMQIDLTGINHRPVELPQLAG